MEYQIIADSCLDATPELMEKLNLVKVPLTINLGGSERIDDETLNIDQFMIDMKNCTEKMGSAAPAPELFRERFEKAGRAFAITLSSKLSCTYENAMIALREVQNPDADLHVFDSKSASAGELLLAIKLRELLDRGEEKASIIAKMEEFIRNMKTYFVLENHDNLAKNGRLGQLAGKIIRVLNIKLIMGADGDGGIQLYAKARGRKNMLRELVRLIQSSGRRLEEARLVISHCNNAELAQELKQAIEGAFHFLEIVVVPTGGLSSLYADDGGIVLAF